MRNFDVVWDKDSLDTRTFQLRGETFVLKDAVRPEALGEKLDALDAARTSPDTTFLDVMLVIDDFIVSMLVPDGGGPDAEARYRKLREQEEGGLSAARIQEVSSWIIEMQTGIVEEETGRPTGSPPGSSRGPRRGARSSTGGSSSRDLQAV